MTDAKACIIDKGLGLNATKCVGMHELGHALGWKDHSSYYFDVMYHSTNNLIALTNRDKNHLVQLY